MPRVCVLCGKPQSQSFAVFSFPSSPKQRAAWVQIITEAKPDLIKDKKFIQSSRLKNGVCELHFLRSEISNGKKRRLSKGAVPSLNITMLQKYKTILKSYKSIFTKSLGSINSKVGYKEHLSSNMDDDYPNGVMSSSMNCDGDSNVKENSILIPDCTIKIEIDGHDLTSSEIRHSMVDDIFGERDDGICLCCGLQTKAHSLFSVLRMETSKDGRSVLDELSSVFEVPKERVIGFSTYLCRKCLKMTEDMLELKSSFLSLLSHLKDKFLVTSRNLETGSKIDSYFEINSNNKNSCKNSHHQDSLSSPTPAKRKSCRLESNEKKFTCHQCDESFESVAALSCHEVGHESDSLSGISLTSTSGIAKTLNENNHCLTCTTKGICSEHSMPAQLDNQKQQIFDCPHCGRYITSKARLNYHLFKFHGIGKEKEKSFSCNLCDRRFSSKPGVRYHEWASHKTGKTYTCEVCSRKFPFRMLYNSHKLFAHGKKNIVCEFCGEMFFTVSKLNVHVNAVHRNALTWLCKFCHEKFTTVSAYRHHVIVKHKRTLYNCSHCNSQFKRKYSLMQHLCKHNIYICQKCKGKFDSASAFIEHMAETHKIDVSDRYMTKSNRKDTVREDHSAVTNASENGSSSLTVPTSKEVQSIVINDILMASNDYENSNLQQLSFQPDSAAKYRDEEKSSFDELSAVESLHFDSVDTLEIQSVTNDSIELQDDVSHIDVQMLEDIHHTSQQDMKTVILPSEKREDDLDSSNVLKNELTMPSSELGCSVTPSQLNDDGPSASEEEALKKIDMINSLNSSKAVTDEALSIPSPHLKSPTFADLPVILQPVKRNDSWTFPTPLQSPPCPDVHPVIHSLTVSGSVSEDGDPPVTREIDITISSEDGEAAKNLRSPKSITDQITKIEDHELPAISVTSMEREKFTINMSCVLNPLQRRIDYEEHFDL